MLVLDLLSEIGFTKEEQEQYSYCKRITGDNLSPIAADYLSGKKEFNEAVELSESTCEDLHKYTLHLLFLLECASFLFDKYNKAGISKEIFVDSMRDIKCKLDECKKVKGIYGTFVVNWYKGFFEMTRFTLGRLQYDVMVHRGDTLEINGYKIKDGDFKLNCHIPSSGPLTYERVVDSLKRAYSFFNDRLNTGILPIRCSSWLLYPPYADVFGEKSNTMDFVRNFEIYCTNDTEKFGDAWRVFGMDIDGDLSKLPRDTAMQRSFIKYIENGGGFGSAKEIILFDGEKILTRKEINND